MPDIELLMPLGEILGVSVNELLAGERLSDEQFRRQADENVVAIARESSFSVKERTEFFKKKWRRENIWLMVVCVLGCAAASAYCSSHQLWGLSPILLISVLLWLNNRMMAYVEDRVYGNPKPPMGG